MDKIKFVDRYMDRPLASLMVKAVFKTRITPNDITFFSFFLGILSAFFFSRGTSLLILIGGILAVLCSIVDGADGMLARAKNLCSEFGSHLDLFLDRVIDFLILAGISAGASARFHNSRLLYLGLFAAGLYLLQIHMFYLTKSFLQIKDMGDNGEARAVLYWAIVIFSIINRLDIFIYALLAETLIVNITRLIYFISLGSKKSRA